MCQSIRLRLTLTFMGLAIGPLLLVGIVLGWRTYTLQQQQARNLQHQVARRVSA
jgi:predicted negative regulator of RcsB-dependent stress response